MSKSIPRKGGRGVVKTFRLPNDLASILVADAKRGNITATDQLVSILRHYAEFDRNAKKFGLITVNKDTFVKLIDAMPDEKIRELGITQSIAIEEFLNFWFHKIDVDSVLEAIRIMSQYLRVFEYTAEKTDHDITIAIRTDMGRKTALLVGTSFERGITRALGVAPKTVIAKNQVNFTLPIRSATEH